jgi:hypothetical protein
MTPMNNMFENKVENSNLKSQSEKNSTEINEIASNLADLIIKYNGEYSEKYNIGLDGNFKNLRPDNIPRLLDDVKTPDELYKIAKEIETKYNISFSFEYEIGNWIKYTVKFK